MNRPNKIEKLINIIDIIILELSDTEAGERMGISCNVWI